MLNTINNYVIRDSKDRVRLRILSLSFNKNGHGIIERHSGIFGSKITSQPVITISSGKAGRSIIQQSTLEYNSRIKEYLDKGYKDLKSLTDKDVSELTESEVKIMIPSIAVDQNGAIKPMLAKPLYNAASKTVNESFYASKKLDGLRCTIKYDSASDSIKSSSRGGGDYNPAIQHLISDPEFVRMYKENPDLITDGELYIHGVPLQNISGACRKELEIDENRIELQYWIYDIVDPLNTFEKRLINLNKLADKYNIKNVIFVEHIPISGKISIDNYANKIVTEGYEGIVLRRPKDVYKPNSRTMFKVKPYQDKEFIISGYELGARGVEDIVFVMQLSKNITFKAKPIGPRQLKQWYFDNIDKIIGKIATIKYFNLSNDGIPTQTIFKSIRDISDL